MTRFSQSIFVTAACFLLVSGAHAALVDSGTFFSDTDSGLDWLKLAPTLERSYNDVSSKFGTGQEFDGWRYATGNEFEQLVLNAGVIPDSDLINGDHTNICDPGVSFCASGRYTPDNGTLTELIAFSDLMGNLAPFPPPSFFYNDAWTVGLISDVDTGNIDPTAHFVAAIALTGVIDSGISTFGSSQAPGDTNLGTGSYLVRASTVPIPAAVWLFCSALGLLGWRRR